MDIVLVNPADLSSPYPPMGLVELGTFLEAEGYSVGIVDFSLEGKKKGIEDIISLNPKVVGVSILFGTIQQANEILAEIQKRIDCILTVGGYYPTFKTKQSQKTTNRQKKRPKKPVISSILIIWAQVVLSAMKNNISTG